MVTRRRPRVVLASRSVRRRELLSRHGVEHEVATPAIDDAGLIPGPVTPEGWVMSLAYLKAWAVLRSSELSLPDGAVLLGADTVCVKDGSALGQPASAEEAERMIRLLEDGSHEVVTGMALLCPRTKRRDIFYDRARVHVGRLGASRIAEYVASGAWRGKAGGYNLTERVEAGWPIEWEGDEETVVGLPVRLLLERLERFAGEEEAAV